MKDKISNLLINIAKKINKRDLYIQELNKIGILNWKDNDESGENYWINNILPKIIENSEDNEIFIFDVGANYGNYSLNLALNLKKQIPNVKLNIHLFEPQDITDLKKLEMESVEIVLNKACVGKIDGEIKLFVSDKKTEHATTITGVIKDNFKYKNQDELIVPVRRLDNYLDLHKIERVDFLKIDTEGNEFDVLSGLGEFLENGKISSIQFEFNEMNVYSRVFFRDFYLLLSGNYNIFRLNKDSLIPIKEYNTFLEIFKFQNFVAVLKGINI